MHGIIRNGLWLAFFASILAAWSVMYGMSTGMGLDLLGRPDALAQAMRQMDPRMDMAMPMAEFGPLFTMWAIMMAAMMLPTLVPTLRAYEDLMVGAGAGIGATRAGWLGLLAGYFAVWVGFAAVIATAQLALLHLGVIDMLGIATSPFLAGGLLIAVGAFQFTRAKELCHGVCHAPTLYFLGRWRAGPVGGARMGLGLGSFCVGCCWGFMALGFVGGVMSLAWMGLATLFMVLEKLPDIGHRVMRPMGLVLIAGGCAVLARPWIMGG